MTPATLLMKNRGNFLSSTVWAFLWMLGLPFAALLALAAYVVVNDARPQSGLIEASVRPSVVLPWQTAHYLITVRPGQGGPAREVKNEPLDVVFAVDVSGSMTASLPAMAAAVRDAVGQLAAAKPGGVRFSLIRYDTEAETVVLWTPDATLLTNGLAKLNPFTGQNDARRMFSEIDRLISSSREGTRRAVIFYTDGVWLACPPQVCPGGPMSEDQIASASKSLRDRGIELFCVGPPSYVVDSLMLDVTGGSARILATADTADLAANFNALASIVSGFNLSRGAQLSNRLDGRYFSAPLGGTPWLQDPTGSLRLDIGNLPTSPMTYGHPVIGHAAGLWRVGTEPVHLIYADGERIMDAHASRRPQVLVITWFALLLPFLPVLAWLLLRLPSPIPIVDEPPPIPVRPRPLPSVLPALPRGDEPGGTTVATLFIGLGRGGQQALDAIRADLKQLHVGSSVQQYQFVVLDTDRTPLAALGFESWEAQEIDRILAPSDVDQTADYLPRPGRVPENQTWFDAAAYEHASRENLNLSDGSKGDRMLARFALWRWLAHHDTPVNAIAAALDKIMALQTEHDSSKRPPVASGQVVVVGCPDGGVGSGWFIDVGRLVKRLARDRQRGYELIPETVGILVSTNERRRPENVEALHAELQTAALTGEFPRKVSYIAKDPLLDREDTENPFDWIFDVQEDGIASAAAQCGAIASVLCQRRPRSAVLQASQPSTGLTHVTVEGLHVVGTLVRDQVASDLVLRLLGPDVLLDIVPTRDGYGARPVAEAEALQALERWLASEPPTTPFRALLGAAIAPEPAASLTRLGDALTGVDPDGSGEWVCPVLRQSVNRLLHGHRDGDTWVRDWRPAEAAAVLRLFADKLAQLSGTEVSLPLPDATLAAARRAGLWSRVTAEGLEEWIANVAASCKDLGSAQQARFEYLDFLRKLNRRTYLDVGITPETREEASRGCLVRWLRTLDTLSPLRERLFFEVDDSVESPHLALRCQIRADERFEDSQQVVRALNQIATDLTNFVPASRLVEVLNSMAESERETVGKRLVDKSLGASAVVLVSPRAVPPDGLSDGCLKKFVQFQVPQPASHGVRADFTGEDRSSIRRISIRTTSPVPLGAGEARFVELAEREAERIRLKITQRYQIAAPQLPPRLRIALADAEGFRSFARAYKGGRVITKDDAIGRQHWWFADSDQFLTFGEQTGLAAAAANFVWHVGTSARITETGQLQGDFLALENWRRGGGLTDDALVLAAVDVVES